MERIRNMTVAILVGWLLLTVFTAGKNKSEQYPYQNPSLPVEARVNDLIGRMTLEEKIMQLDMFWGKEITAMKGHEATEIVKDSLDKYIGKTGIGSIHDFYPQDPGLLNEVQHYAMENTRLGIPVLFIEEGLHGYEGFGSTSFPVPIALASAWDTGLVRKAGRAIATEARGHGINMILGPVLCLPRDARWGRVEETYGEDPYLSAVNGIAIIKGLQGVRLSDPNSVIAEPKHFAVHGIPEAGSNTAPVNIGEREARSSFLYVFERAVREGGAQSMMAAYSEIDGIPCVDNRWLLTDVLRKEWGFKGFVLSDLGAIRMSLERHKVASSVSEALAQTFKAGMNMQFYDFGHTTFLSSMKEAIAKKYLSIQELNKAVHDVLRVKFLLGLFDHPYVDVSVKDKVFHSEEHQALALKLAQQSICLLKNENEILPIKGNVHSIAVIGELATSTYLGGYSNKEGRAISILDGLNQRAEGKFIVHYEKGYGHDSTQASSLLANAVGLVKRSDIAVVVVGEKIEEVGEGKDRAHLDLDDDQLNLLKALQETGKPVIAVLRNGRPLCINWIAGHVPAIVESWFLGEKSGLAVADVLLGKVNPSGKLPMTFPSSVGQIPIYYNQKPTSSHRYVDEKATPLFEFGRGLSYTSFSYSNISVSPSQIPVNGSATVKVLIKNTGQSDGAEVAQLYIRDVVSSVTTPVMSLRGFDRVYLKPGESKIISFRLDGDALSLWNRQMKKVVEPGEFLIMVGSSSRDIRQTATLTVR